MKNTKKLLALLLAALCVGSMVISVSLISNAATSITKAKFSSVASQIYTKKAIKPTLKVTYKSKTLKNGKDYTLSYKNNVNVGVATITVKGKGSYSGTKTIKFNITSPAVKNLKVSKSSYTSVTLTWSASAKATGYYLYQYNASSKAYAKVKTTTKTSVTVSGLKAGSTYTYKVRPYNKLSNNKVLAGPYCSAIKAYTLAAKVSGLAQTKATSSYITLTWNKSAGASGYQVYLFDFEADKYVKKATVATNTATVKSLSPNLSTTVKVRPYRKINGKYTYSAFCSEFNIVTLPKGTVTNVDAKPTPTSIHLFWDEWKEPDGFKVYQVVNGKNQLLKTLTDNEITFENLEPYQTYTYKVVAFCAGQKKSFNTSSVSKSVITLPTFTMSAPASLSIGAQAVCTLQMNPANAPKTGFYWACEPSAVAKISSTTGVVTGVSTGTAKITVYDSYGYSQSADIRISEPVTGVSVYPTALNMTVGSVKQLSYQILPSTNTTNSGVSFISNKPSVVRCDQTGLVTAVAPGKATITVTSKDNSLISTSCAIEVTAAKEVQSISIDSSLSLYKGQTFTVNPIFIPQDAADKSFTLSIEDKTVKVSLLNSKTYKATDYFTISGNKITAKQITNVPGPFTLTVKSKNGKKSTCELSVIEQKIAVTGVSISSELQTWYPGMTGRLTATVTPANATDKSVQWLSDNTSVATIDAFGTVTAISSGRATIYATTVDGKKSAVYIIDVNTLLMPTSVKIDYGNLELLPGSTFKLSATVLPENANDTSVVWTSSNKAVATVDANGTVKALQVGECIITAQSAVDGSVKDTRTVTVMKKELTISPKTEYENCKSGDTYQLYAYIYPSTLSQQVYWESADTSIATVSDTGLVRIVSDSGSTYITVSCASDPALKKNIIFNTSKYVLPDISTASNLLYAVSSRMNTIKNTDMPAFRLRSQVDFKNVNLKTPSALVSKETFADLFMSDLVEDEDISLGAVTPDAVDYDKARTKYLCTLPVKGYANAIRPNLDTTAIDMGKSQIVNRETSYDINLVLKQESFSALPEKKADTKHGKVFDILYKDYIDECVNQINNSSDSALKLEMSYKSFKTTYHDCKLSITVDKSTNKVISATYDMSVLVEIGQFRMAAGIGLLTPDMIKSDVSFDVNSVTNIEFTY